ncbi:MAG TPA: ankyrin repeat domain-containing protein [Phycisphaerae bacterium]|nr:ankyrin repeat domain-containing protein [Phycisphaerae bacterium]
MILTASVALASFITFAAIAAWGYVRESGSRRSRRLVFVVPLLAWFGVGLVLVATYWPRMRLSCAIRGGDLQTVQSLLSEHPEWLESKSIDLDGDTPLGEAVMAGRQEVVALLLKQGARTDPQVVTPPLVQAAFYGRVEIGEMLLRHGANPDQTGLRDRNPAIELAAWFGHEAFVRLLLAHGVDLDAGDMDGDTALMSASERGHERVVDLLLGHGADVSLSNRFGCTALHKAAAGGYESIVVALLAHGADVNASDYRGTAIHVAVTKGHAGVVRLLIRSHADLTTAPPLSRVRDQETRQVLKEAGAER